MLAGNYIKDHCVMPFLSLCCSNTMAYANSNPDHPKHGNITSDGTNTGATMSIHHRPAGAQESNCCCVNIYVNNNVQGATNSILFGSKVIVRDPGVRVVYRQGHGMKAERAIIVQVKADAEKYSAIRFELCILLALLFVFILSTVSKLTL